MNYIKLHPDVLPLRQAYGETIGWDIAAFLLSENNRIQQITLAPGSSRTIPTGLKLFPPDGYFIAICSRSGHAAGSPPIFVANAPGIIDPDYTDELKVILFNGGHSSVNIKHGDYVAQLVLFSRPPQVTFTEIPAVAETTRGNKGFGSTEKQNV